MHARFTSFRFPLSSSFYSCSCDSRRSQSRMSLLTFSSILRRSSCVASRARAYASTPAKGPEGGKRKAIPKSACTVDTVITGVNYLKGQPPVLALPDEEYPEWLWTVLDPRVWPDDGPGGRAERAKRRAENRRKIQDANFMSTQ
ncbi:mitochondrial ribosomal protein L37-domain-containing protein [Mycena epipterygia]|nr:mitochondrial ribosomal protein L37-domain-containing protein [Mycena epipterygia]